MVDVGGKDVTDRRAVARAVRADAAGDAGRRRTRRRAEGRRDRTARIAGIQAAKRTAELIPLCHPLPLSFVDVAIEVGDGEVTRRRPRRARAPRPAWRWRP